MKILFLFTPRDLLPPTQDSYGLVEKRNEMRHCYAAHNLLNCALSCRMGGPQLFASDASSPSNDVPIFIFTKIHGIVLQNASINFHKKKKNV